jgi:hypothetical protein
MLSAVIVYFRIRLLEYVRVKKLATTKIQVTKRTTVGIHALSFVKKCRFVRLLTCGEYTFLFLDLCETEIIFACGVLQLLREFLSSLDCPILLFIRW